MFATLTGATHNFILSGTGTIRFARVMPKLMVIPMPSERLLLSSLFVSWQEGAGTGGGQGIENHLAQPLLGFYEAGRVGLPVSRRGSPHNDDPGATTSLRDSILTVCVNTASVEHNPTDAPIWRERRGRLTSPVVHIFLLIPLQDIVQ